MTTSEPVPAGTAAARDVEFKIHDARFILSKPFEKDLPKAEGPELAFIGRSNVGKSSLLNTLVERKGLVKVSRTPGRTRLINLFAVDVTRSAKTPEGPQADRRTIYLVDLPGYGYADPPKSERRKCVPMIDAYVDGRLGLAAVCHLFDIRHAPSAQDEEAFFALAQTAPAHVLVATKADKLPLAKRRPALKTIAKPFGISAPQILLFSSTTRQGRVELWDRLWQELP